MLVAGSVFFFFSSLSLTLSWRSHPFSIVIFFSSGYIQLCLHSSHCWLPCIDEQCFFSLAVSCEWAFGSLQTSLLGNDAILENTVQYMRCFVFVLTYFNFWILICFLVVYGWFPCRISLKYCLLSLGTKLESIWYWFSELPSPALKSLWGWSMQSAWSLFRGNLEAGVLWRAWQVDRHTQLKRGFRRKQSSWSTEAKRDGLHVEERKLLSKHWCLGKGRTD